MFHELFILGRDCSHSFPIPVAWHNGGQLLKQKKNLIKNITFAKLLHLLKSALTDQKPALYEVLIVSFFLELSPSLFQVYISHSFKIFCNYPDFYLSFSFSSDLFVLLYFKFFPAAVFSISFPCFYSFNSSSARLQAFSLLSLHRQYLLL